MRNIAFLALAVATSANAQTTNKPPEPQKEISYRIDFIRPDSFYLVEVKTTVDQPGKRGKVEEESLLLTDTTQLVTVIEHAKRQDADFMRRAAEFRRLSDEVTRLYGTLKEKINLARQ